MNSRPKYYELSAKERLGYFISSFSQIGILLCLDIYLFITHGQTLITLKPLIYVVLLIFIAIDIILARRNLRVLYLNVDLNNKDLDDIILSIDKSRNWTSRSIEESEREFISYVKKYRWADCTLINIKILPNQIAISCFNEPLQFSWWFTSGERSRNIRAFIVALCSVKNIDTNQFKSILTRNEWNLKNTTRRIFAYLMYCLILFLGFQFYWGTIWIGLPIFVGIIGGIYIVYDLKVLLK